MVTNVCEPGSAPLVFCVTCSPTAGFDRAACFKSIRFAGVRAQPLFLGNLVWHSGRAAGRGRLDGVCIPENAFAKPLAASISRVGSAVECVASAGSRLSRYCVSTPFLLAPFFLCLHARDDRDESGHRVDLRPHAERLALPVDAHQFNRLPRSFQRAESHGWTRSGMVRHLRWGALALGDRGGPLAIQGIVFVG